MSSNTVQPGAHILVTGATGYIGAHVVDQFLKAGYRVTGTARSQAKAEKIQKAFEKYGNDRLDFIITGDLEGDGAFDDAVKEVDAIAHVASPVTFTPTDPFKDVINPAINGTLSLLQSAIKYGKNVKHVVVTSSIVACIQATAEKSPYIFTEKDWNDQTIEDVRHWKQGDPVNGSVTYAASKNEAERAVWRFQKEKTPPFTINTVLPAVNLGPLIPKPEVRSDISGSSSASIILRYFTGDNRDVTTFHNYNVYVHVEDVALAHVRAIERGRATNGERFLIAAGNYSGQEVVDIMRKHFPEQKDNIEEGKPGNYPQFSNTVDGTKATRQLGIEYKDLETTIVELVENVRHVYK